MTHKIVSTPPNEERRQTKTNYIRDTAKRNGYNRDIFMNEKPACL